jgi:hypothetical protein
MAGVRKVTERYSDLYGEMSVKPNMYNAPHKGYKHSMRTYVWVTLLVIGVMTALWFIMGVGSNAQGTIPPSFAFGPSDLYFHSIAIAIAALLVYLVIMAFDLEKYEPNIDFPIAYRAMMATVIGAVGAFFYLRPIFNAEIAPVPLGIMIVALLILADVGGALMVQLYLLPGKLTKRYDPEQNMMGMIPKWKYLPKWSDFRKMDLAYWLTLTTVVVAFIAGVIGFVVLWVNYFTITIGSSPAIFDGYITWIGGAANWLAYTMGSHSHVMGMAIILGAVAVTAKRFNVLNLTGFWRNVAKLGMWVSIIGLLVMVATFLLEAFTTTWPNATPPLLFASNPGNFQLWSSTASNGMAGDDSTMFLASLGAIILLVPLLLTRIRDKPAWRDPIRLSIIATWIIAYIATPLEGFFIEFNEATMHGGPTDIVFGNLQYFALFGITMVTLSFLAIDFFQDNEGVKKAIAAAGIFVLLFTLVAGFIYAFVDPGTLNPDGSLSMTTWGLVFAVGLLLVSFVVIAATVAVRSSKYRNKLLKASDGISAVSR